MRIMSTQNDALLVLVVMTMFLKPHEACTLLVPRGDYQSSGQRKPLTTPPPPVPDAAAKSPGHHGGVSFGATMANNKRRLLLSPNLWKKNAAVNPTTSNSAPVEYDYLLRPSLQWKMPTPPGRDKEGNGH
ncbi:unnamed protein product [Cuscuta europaea]|uniref:Secreted protein n=1 Tax=Cuscuta europaea TaxID=41803 RepID=A0A9P1E2E1_CUSEU|nr:unnamed protein product [Cuscuta europaea]